MSPFPMQARKQGPDSNVFRSNGADLDDRRVKKTVHHETEKRTVSTAQPATSAEKNAQLEIYSAITHESKHPELREKISVILDKIFENPANSNFKMKDLSSEDVNYLNNLFSTAAEVFESECYENRDILADFMSIFNLEQISKLYALATDDKISNQFLACIGGIKAIMISKKINELKFN